MCCCALWLGLELNKPSEACADHDLLSDCTLNASRTWLFFSVICTEQIYFVPNLSAAHSVNAQYSIGGTLTQAESCRVTGKAPAAPGTH